MPRPWSRQYVPFPPQVRRAILQRDPICTSCRIRRSTVADHRVPRAEGGGNDLANGQGLCDLCHREKTKIESRRGQQRRAALRRRPTQQHPSRRG